MMDNTIYWTVRWCIFVLIYHSIVVCRAVNYPDLQASPLRHSLWYKHLNWENQPSRQNNAPQNIYRREPIYQLTREQFGNGNQEEFLLDNAQPSLKSSSYLSKEAEKNDRKKIVVADSDGHKGYIDVEVYKQSPIKDVEEEENLDGPSDQKSNAVSAPHPVQSVINQLKIDEKKSPEPVEQTEHTSNTISGTGSHLPLAYQQKKPPEKKDSSSFSDVYFVAIVAGCSAVAIFGVISAGYCFYKLQKSSKAAADVDYPAYGVTGPSKDTTSPNGDRKLAQSAQMYHYQHQKQQMIAVEKASSTHHASTSDVDSEEENEEGDYTVYECPGLASTGEMEVRNPLFNDDSTPVSPPVVTPKPPEK